MNLIYILSKNLNLDPLIYHFYSYTLIFYVLTIDKTNKNTSIKIKHISSRLKSRMSIKNLINLRGKISF